MKSPVYKFVVLSILTIFVTEFIKYYLNLESLLYNSLSEQISSQQLESYIEAQKKWQWLLYLFIPLFLLIKIFIVASILYVGTFFYSKIEITFKELWHVVLIGEFIFLLIPISKIFWFHFFSTNYTLEDIQYFYPLSALNIVGHKGLEPWLIYPFQVLNLFELAYWLVLAYFIGKITETNMDRGLKIVASSYGSALLLWVVVIMFFTLNYS